MVLSISASSGRRLCLVLIGMLLGSGIALAEASRTASPPHSVRKAPEGRARDAARRARPIAWDHLRQQRQAFVECFLQGVAAECRLLSDVT
jgi:hypothetical protein